MEGNLMNFGKLVALQVLKRLFSPIRPLRTPFVIHTRTTYVQLETMFLTTEGEFRNESIGSYLIECASVDEEILPFSTFRYDELPHCVP